MPIDSNALINSRETTDEEISELAQLSAEARAKLKPWLDTVAPKTALQTLGIGKGAPWRAGINGLGGAEGVSNWRSTSSRARTASTGCWNCA